MRTRKKKVLLRKLYKQWEQWDVTAPCKRCALCEYYRIAGDGVQQTFCDCKKCWEDVLFLFGQFLYFPHCENLKFSGIERGDLLNVSLRDKRRFRSGLLKEIEKLLNKKSLCGK